MKIKILFFLVAFFVATSAHAGKPEWAGKGKPTAAQREAQRTTNEAKKEHGKNEKVNKGKKEKQKGIEKQKTMKSEQVQKELGKGSEKGQETREKRKKWWQFF